MALDWLTGAWIVGGGATLGILTAGWQHVQGFLVRMRSRMVVTIEMTVPMDRAFRSYMHAHLKKSRFGVRFFSAMTAFVRSKRRWEMVPYETASKDVSVYWKGWRPLWVHIQNEEDEPKRLRVSFVRGMFNGDRLVLDAADHWNRLSSGVGFIDWSHDVQRFQIIRVFGTGGQGERHATSKENNNEKDRRANELSMYEHKVMGYNPEDLGPELHDRHALDMLAMSRPVVDAVEEAKHWIHSEGWFRERGVPWRRGWLLYGPPGTGKTSLVRAIAEDLDLPVYLFDLASLSNRELVSAWDEMLEHTPCIALMEDLDSVFEGRANKLGESGGGLTFDCVLNTIDGVERSDGLFTIITTNLLDTIDPAIALTRKPTAADDEDMPTRPGRVDRIIELGTLEEAGREKLAHRILGDWPQAIPKAIKAGEGDTGAQFQERCMRIALAHFWREREAAAEKEPVQAIA